MSRKRLALDTDRRPGGAYLFRTDAPATNQAPSLTWMFHVAQPRPTREDLVRVRVVGDQVLLSLDTLPGLARKGGR